MMIYVFSDSHGSAASMLQEIENGRPDRIIHLGDGRNDTDKIRAAFPDIPLKAVRGNCDTGSILPDRELLYINGLKILITHGHLYGVKGGPGGIVAAGKSAGAGLVLYGHTHAARHDSFDGVDTLNPGSCGMGRTSFAILEVSDEGRFSVQIKPL
jgi:putative phosphoesterase